MINIADYIVDTQGVLSPREVMNHMNLYWNKNNTFILVSGVFSHDNVFDDLDGKLEKFKLCNRVRYLSSKKFGLIDLQDVFILEHKAERIIYE
jgi:hypothetical protein